MNWTQSALKGLQFKVLMTLSLYASLIRFAKKTIPFVSPRKEPFFRHIEYRKEETATPTRYHIYKAFNHF